MMDERSELLLMRTSDAIRRAVYMQYQCDSLLYECVRSKISTEVISERTGIAVQNINRRVHDFSVRLEEAS